MENTARISQANGRLKAARVGTRIEEIGDRLYIRATLPPRPGSTRTDAYQQRVALSIHANPAGIKIAEAEARKIGALLDCKEFDWSAYQRQQKPESVADWLDRFTEQKQGTVSETTWKTEYQRVFSRLDSSAALTVELLRSTILQTEPNSRQRVRFCTTLEALAKFAGLETDFRNLEGNYSAAAVDPRTLPDDGTIAEWFERIGSPGWKWVYGAIATFGLRNHEVFYLDTAALVAGETSVRVLEGKGKTIARQVWAFHPEWIDAFGLRSPSLPAVTGKTHADLGHRVSQFFRRLECPFGAYDLRHAWAVRTIHYGLPDTLAARQMGHSVAVHTNIYHHWISGNEQQRVYELLTGRADRPRAP